MKKKWWLGTTLLETLILSIVHGVLLWCSSSFHGIGWIYFWFSVLQVILRAIGYRGSFEMTSEWFKSKRHTNMGLAYAFYLPQIFLLSLELNHDKNIPYFNKSTYSMILYDFIFLSFCMNILTIIIVCCSQTLYKSKKTCIAIMIIFCIMLYYGLNIHHYSYNIACLLFVVIVFVLSKYFPGCLSLGEYSIICQALILSFLIFVQKYYYQIPPKPTEFELRTVTKILICTTCSCFITIFIYSILTNVYETTMECKNKKITEITCVLINISIVIGLVIGSINYYTEYGITEWILNFFTIKRIIIAIWWLGICIGTILFIIYAYKNPPSGSGITIYRKVFHLAVALCYIPGIIFDEDLLYYASCGVLYIMCLIECMRLSKFTGFSGLVKNLMIPFLKPECQSWFIIPNHFILLITISLPIWIVHFIYFGPYNNIFVAHRLNFLLSSVISVGIGDAMASIIGVKFGKHKIANGPKTYEGAFASFIVQFILYEIVFRCYTGLLIPTYFDLIYLFSSLTTSIIESLTLQEDNIISCMLSMSLMIALIPNCVY